MLPLPRDPQPAGAERAAFGEGSCSHANQKNVFLLKEMVRHYLDSFKVNLRAVDA